jgi:hypothetical protein
VTWRLNGAVVTGTGNSRNLDLAGLGVSTGDVVEATVQDETEFVRDPSFKNGPRMTQTRQWTVGAPLTPTPVDAAFTLYTPTDRPVGGEEVVFVETTHPTDRVLDVTWVSTEPSSPIPPIAATSTWAGRTWVPAPTPSARR